MSVVKCGGDDELTRAVTSELSSLGYSVVEEETVKASVVLCGSDFRMAPEGVDRATKALEDGGLLVLASRHGSSRTNEFAFAFRNARGDLSRAREAEDAVKLATRKAGRSLSFAIVRLGGDARPTASAAALEVGDGLDAPTSVAVAAQALAKTCVVPFARNQTFAVAGGTPSTDWDDVFLKLDGPELFRQTAAPDVDRAEVVEWFREWATLWTRADAPLTTPVEAQPTPDGVQLLFVDTKQTKNKPPRRKGNNGGVRLRLDADPTTQGPRARVTRTPYDEGIAVKEMSEAEILNRFKRDFVKQWGP